MCVCVCVCVCVIFVHVAVRQEKQDSFLPPSSGLTPLATSLTLIPLLQCQHTFAEPSVNPYKGTSDKVIITESECGGEKEKVRERVGEKESERERKGEREREG